MNGNGSELDIRSYTTSNTATAVATGNTLNTGSAKKYIKNMGTVTAQDGITVA